MANFATVEDVEKILLIEISDADAIASVEFHLAAATEAIQIHVEQWIEWVEDDSILLDSRGTYKLNVPELPVTEISEVTEDGDVLVADDDYKLNQYSVLIRIGQRWSEGIQNIGLTYSHGFDPIPDIIKSICARAASRGYQAALKSAEDEGIPGIASKSLGDFSVSYGGEGGSTGDGTLGASAARVLLLSEKDILDKFKIGAPSR